MEKNKNHTEQVSYSYFIIELTKKVDNLQEAFNEDKSNEKIKIQKYELLKAILTGWTTFAIIFLVLFYTPIKEAISSIPQKVKSAEKIELGGVTLIDAIEKEAKKVGKNDLFKTIPLLSKDALELFIKIPNNGNNIWRYSPVHNNQYKALWLPKQKFLNLLKELEEAKLITIKASRQKDKNNLIINTKDMSQYLHSITEKFEGTKHNYPDNYFIYKFNTPIKRTKIIPIRYQLSTIGEEAKNIIINAVLNELKSNNSKN
jgi:hypothetical protein